MKCPCVVSGIGLVVSLLPVCFFTNDMTWVNTTDITLTELVLPDYCHSCECMVIDKFTLYTDCSKRRMYNPPYKIDKRTWKLNLQGNLIATIHYEFFTGLVSLKELDLSSNIIENIDVGAFKDLISLEKLYLHSNAFSSFQIMSTPEVFDGLRNLRILTIHNNFRISQFNDSFTKCSMIEYLTSLESLTIDDLANATFHTNFRNLTHLSTLTMSGITGICELYELRRDSLQGFENIRSLTLEKCQINNIEVGTFWDTPKLEYLDLSWNSQLQFMHFGKIAEELQYTQLNILKLNAIHNPYRAGSELLCEYLHHFRNLMLSELYLDDNGIEYIAYGVSSMLPSTLKCLYMRRNRLMYGLYMYEIVFNNRDLDIFDAGDQAITVRSDKTLGAANRASPVAFEAERKKRYSDSTFQTAVPLKIKKLIFGGSRTDLRPLDFNNTENNITYMDISRNYIPSIRNHEFLGYTTLTYLNLSHNYIEHVLKHGFKHLISVESLDLEDNILGNVLDLDRNGRLFSDLQNLRMLNLSRNRIYRLDKSVFHHLRSLQHLDLSDNYLLLFDIDVSFLERILYIDISNNHIQSIPLEIREVLSKVSVFQNLTVDLRGNVLACNCETIQFLHWLLFSHVNFVDLEKYYCTLNNGTLRVFDSSNDVFLRQLEAECVSYLGIIAGCSTVGSFIVAFILASTLYLNRWKLRYLYYMAKIKFDNDHGMNIENVDFAYDVFVSYGDGDRNFVMHDLHEHLETIEGFRLNIRDRDFDIGEDIALNISKAIRTSKKTFLLISRHFLRNKWCNFETNMARMESVHMARRLIVIIFLEEIPPDVLPIEIVDLLLECPNLNLPKEGLLREAFWQKCVECINMP